MKAAVVRAFDRPPSYATFEDPRPAAEETLIRVRAAATSRFVRARAAGRHYSATAVPPFVAGVDGVGEASDGRRLYFQFPRYPFGAMAELAPVPRDQTVAVPEALDDAAAAAAAVSGMSCWVPLTRLAPVRPGEAVLVNGATGAAGRMAVQVAKRLGAARVVATGRDPGRLERLADLGADERIPIGESMDAFRAAVRREASRSPFGVVLDYLWGPTAEAILGALGGPDAPGGPARVRFVQIGAMTGERVGLDASLLRSSGLEVLGSGYGSSSAPELLRAIGEFFVEMARAPFAVEFDRYPLADVEQAWPAEREHRRQVYLVG